MCCLIHKYSEKKVVEGKNGLYLSKTGKDIDMAIYYHGSSVLFDSFDLGHALEGDGKAKFGYGVYVAGTYGSAVHYAFNKKRPENRDYYVYTVEIPDRTPDNCLSLLKKIPVSGSIVSRTETVLGEVLPSEAKAEGIPFRKYLANKLTGVEKPVRQMVDKATVEGEKAAAAFLLSIGVELIEWPHSWTSPDGEKNMAVLDDTKVRIRKIEKVCLDEKGHHLVPGSEILIKEC